MLPLPDNKTLLLGNAQDDVRQRLDAIRLQQRLDGSPDAKGESKLREASQDFEALFLHQLLKQMRATVPKEGLLHGKGEEFWQSHFDMEMATVMARSGGIGLGDMIFEQLRQSQVQATRASDPVGKPMGMTILPPMENDPPDPVKNTDQDEILKVSLQSNAQTTVTAQGPYAPPDSRVINSHPIASNSNVMSRVRSLAQSIEDRGGVVPEHPGFVHGLAPIQDIGATTSLPPMHWPLQGRVSSGFGWRNDPFTGEQSWHAGTDLVAPKGSPIDAAWDGRVVFVGQRGGYGNMVVLEHAGGWRSYYAHNERNRVKVGDMVQAGQSIATVGSSGRSTGPHLHFEIRQGNMAWDPKQIRDRLLAGLSIGKIDSA
ncbi:Rod binding protein [Desulfonatronum thiosulfatophilum]|uniref:Rod binding protein n=1 Tax=Desulfonatronum thiosulfatophilum TaxID=617002 RepID=A0A1G6DJB2_9BACT|nr:peptidoglycan DD-metalloendopeptidase family protein [Desulfonatronum thiosulfatophilum]SDB44915.1 Rod binding protein [Desulfonatronum thiosulfatophilum]